MELWQKIADRLKQDLSKYAWESLPSLKDLSQRYSVSYGTVRRATSQLSKEGILELGRGRRAQIASQNKPPVTANSPEYAFDRVYRALCELIQSGKFKVGAALPKTDSLALNKLLQENQVHRRKKNYCIGSASQELKKSSSKRSSIIILQLGDSSWQALYNPVTSQFVHSLVQESIRLQIPLLPVLIDINPKNNNLVPFENILQKTVYPLGGLLMGILIVSPPYTIPNYSDLLIALSGLDIPILDFSRRKIAGNPKFRPHHFGECLIPPDKSSECAIKFL